MQCYSDAQAKAHPETYEIADVDAELFETYKEYFFGDYCYGLRTAESAGATIPPWTLVLGYEHAIRKFACELVTQKSMQLGAAVKRYGVLILSVYPWTQRQGCSARSILAHRQVEHSFLD